MAKTFPVGHVRVNPNTFMTEVWDGSTWNSGLSTIASTTTIPYPIGSNGNITSSKPTISATERELIFEFLKENMRVAEYVQRDGKPPIVQLEIRAGEGYVWEQVKRVKTTDPL